MFLISATFGQELWAKDGKVCFFYYIGSRCLASR